MILTVPVLILRSSGNDPSLYAGESQFDYITGYLYTNRLFHNYLAEKLMYINQPSQCFQSR